MDKLIGRYTNGVNDGQIYEYVSGYDCIIGKGSKAHGTLKQALEYMEENGHKLVRRENKV
jgi:hypothetical protein